jgi:cytidine deaminase
MNQQKLINAAKKAQARALAPYSRLKVGAALATPSGKIYTGCNIENSSFSLTICAERTALFKAVSEGQHRFSAIAITSDARQILPPCGACRQVLMELAGNIDIILTDGRGTVAVHKLSELLPLPFDGSVLKNL